MNSRVKIVVFVPDDYADAVRRAIGESGAGSIGKYRMCTFSTSGVGRFLPVEGATPSVGRVGEPQAVDEERIETFCERERLQEVLAAIRKAHPYETPIIDVYPLEDTDYLSKLSELG